METINIDKWNRSPATIEKKIKVVGDKVIAKEKMSIIFPAKFVDKDLTILDNVCKILGIISLVDENGNYSIMTVPAQIDIVPNEIIDISINDEHYYKLVIEPNEELISSIMVIQNLDYVYSIFDLFILQGKVPWYIEYEDLIEVFKNYPEFIGVNVGKDTLPFEVFVAMNGRSPQDLNIEYRNIITDKKQLSKTKPVWLGLKNVYYSFRSTISKISGAYFKEGIISAVVNKQDNVTDIEKVLRA